MQGSPVFPGVGSSSPPCRIHRCCKQGRKHQAAFKQMVQIPANSTSCISFLRAIKQIEICLLPKLFSLSHHPKGFHGEQCVNGCIICKDGMASSAHLGVFQMLLGTLPQRPWDSAERPHDLGYSSCSGDEAREGWEAEVRSDSRSLSPSGWGSFSEAVIELGVNEADSRVHCDVRTQISLEPVVTVWTS